MAKDSMSILEHLDELRRRLVYSALALVGGAVVGWIYVKPIMEIIQLPARQAGLEKLVFLAPQEAFFTSIKVALLAGLVVASPVILYQILAFVWPALERHERRFVLFTLPAVVLLFVLGVTFASVVLIRFVLGFFLNFGGPELEATISLSSYVSLIVGLILPFGVVFQLPVMVAFLAQIGIIGPDTLPAMRRFAVPIVFILSAILTPPDVVSQLAMAGPMLVLYEISIWIARFIGRRHQRREAEWLAELESDDE